MNIDINAILAAKLLGGGGGGGSYAQFGPGTELVGRKLEKTIHLSSDTSFDSWTASTTAGQIKAASSTADFSIDMPNYDYAWTFVTHCYVDVKYLAGATLKKTPKRFASIGVVCIYPYYKDENSVASGYNAWQVVQIYMRNMLRYYGGTEGVLATTTSASGPMFINQDPGFSAGTTTTYKLPKIQAVCNTNYFTTDRKAEVDSEHTDMIVTCDVYKTPVADHYIGRMLEAQRTDLTAGL